MKELLYPQILMQLDMPIQMKITHQIVTIFKRE